MIYVRQNWHCSFDRGGYNKKVIDFSSIEFSLLNFFQLNSKLIAKEIKYGRTVLRKQTSGKKLNILTTLLMYTTHISLKELWEH